MIKCEHKCSISGGNNWELVQIAIKEYKVGHSFETYGNLNIFQPFPPHLGVYSLDVFTCRCYREGFVWQTCIPVILQTYDIVD